VIKEIIPSFKPRPYQYEFFRQFFLGDKKRFLNIIHRRAGKDTTAFNMCWMAALMKPGLYLYLLPLVKQSRTVIWRGRGKDGISFLDRIPAPLIKSVHNGNQTIDLVNNSIIMVGGADNYDGLAGTNPLWTFLSEYQNMNPLAWELILRPILSENKGGSCIFGTPRGHNHLYEMYQTNKKNPDWYVSIMTVNDTQYEDGTPIITDEMIDQERRAGMPEELIQQEYYCSFEAAIQGAYFSEQMSGASKAGRICDFEIDRDLPVHTSWDIGMRDATSIGLYQSFKDGSLRCIYHMEDRGKHAEYWVLELKKLQERLKFKRWGLHFLPHDVRVNEWGGGRTRVEVLQSSGINPRIVRNHRISERIQAIRSMFPRFWIHESNCKHLIRAAQEYHADYDPKKGIYSTAPAHNWASHAMDQLGYFALGYMDSYDKRSLQKVQKYASFMP
jgi:hypothetical protein